MIRIRNIKKNIKYQKPLNIESLDIKEGEIYSILGHNGCGKSTLLKILYQIEKFNSGNIDINNEGFSEETVEKYMAYNPQRACFLRGTLKDNFDYIYKYSKTKDLLERSELKLLIEEFNLEERLKTDVKKLSGGEQAKAQFIRTLILNKNYILLDEPMASMDFQTISIVENKIKELKEKNKAVILVTHDFIQAKRISDRIIFMENLDLIGNYNPNTFFEKVL